MISDPARILFMYWGRRGPMTRVMLELGQAAAETDDVAATVSVSRHNEAFVQFAPFGAALLPVDTFSSGAGAVTQAWRIPALRRSLARRIAADRTDIVIDLMPHVWSPLVIDAVRRAGARYVAIVHDAEAHPGDRTAWANRWLHRAASRADGVITLSEAVTKRVVGSRLVAAPKVTRLFHPDLRYGTSRTRPARSPGDPIRLLFLGRILPYKGIGLLVDAVEQVVRSGVPVQLGMFGEGDLEAVRPRLVALGAEIRNRWLSELEIEEALARHDVMVLSHTEASQSGCVAAAFGAGLPVICTPVGGLVDQVADGRTGLVATQVDAGALAAAIRRLAADEPLRRTLGAAIAADRQDRSIATFLARCADLARQARVARADADAP